MYTFWRHSPDRFSGGFWVSSQILCANKGRAWDRYAQDRHPHRIKVANHGTVLSDAEMSKQALEKTRLMRWRGERDEAFVRKIAL
jgi:hypothetical protein